MKGIRNLAIVFAVAAAAWAQTASSPAPETATGVRYSTISPDDMKEWLSYLASDELLGRQIFTEGYGLAAQYVADHLRQWGVKPLNPDGTYFQPVTYKSYRVTRNSTVSVTADGQTKNFKHGDHVVFPVTGGGKQSLSFTSVEFVGYGQERDLQGGNLTDKLVVTIPNLTLPPAASQFSRRAPRDGAAGAITNGAKAAISYTPAPGPASAAELAVAQAQAALDQANAALVREQQAQRGRGGVGAQGGGANGGGAAATVNADLRSVQRVDGLVAPLFTGDQTFYEALFEGSSVKWADILGMAQRGEPIAPVTLNARVTINIDNTFTVINEQISHNVVGVVEGSDPVLKDTYVMFGAHLDHIGYSQNGTNNSRGSGTDACRRRSSQAQAAVTASGKVVQRRGNAGGAGGGGGGAGGAGGANTGARGPAANAVPLDQRDLINNGADDDGSGSTSELAIAKAFATGPKPKRSVIFIWHTGEEAGLYGSQYNADFPIVPLEKVQAQLNIDMVGRDDCNDIEGDYSNSLFVIGADRISTDLHNLIVAANASQQRPLVLDYEMNDPNDPESVYTRSDHYSYASKGIPIAFFTTGLHPDYHRVTDTVDKILFPKMSRIAQLIYETGFSIADTDRILLRDNKGSRTGFGSKAEIIPR